MTDFSMLSIITDIVFTWQYNLAMVCGILFGLVVGVLPGLTSALGIAIALPLTFRLDPMTSLILLTSVYTGGLTGGGILAILLNTPGTPAAVATTFDGYPMTCKGLANEVLGIQIASSVFGGLLSFFFVILLIRPMTHFALLFGPSEMVALIVLVIVVISTLHGKYFSRSIFSGLLGLLMSTIGMSNVTGIERGTFGLDVLVDGLPPIICIVGLFAIPELIDLTTRESITKADASFQARGTGMQRLLQGVRMVADYPRTALRGGFIGIFVGLLPAAGAAMASLMSYVAARNAAKPHQRFGEGEPEGVVAAEVANNASEGGAMACLMCLGIPGSGSTAILMGGFFMHGLMPGPNLMRDTPELVYGILTSCIFQMCVLGFLALLVAFCTAKLIKLPNRIIIPMLMVIIALSAYSYRGQVFDIGMLYVFGMFGWLLRQYHFTQVNFMIGFLLGKNIEMEVYRSISLFSSNIFEVFHRPTTAAICVVTGFFILLQIRKVFFLSGNKREKRA